MSGNDFAIFDVAIYDDAGALVVDIVDFTMKRLDHASALTGDAAREGDRAVPASRLGAVIEQGIKPNEGTDAFARILAARVGGPIVASSIDLLAWIQKVEADAQSEASGEADHREHWRASHVRRSAPPSSRRGDDVRARPRFALWLELLGVEETSAFTTTSSTSEGSRSSRCASSTRSASPTKWIFRFSTLFEAPTIAQCAAIIREEAGLVPQRRLALLPL